MLAAIHERGHSIPTMWAHYGEEYGGVCLVFERSTLDTAVRTAAEGASVHCGRVAYRNPPVGLSLNRPDGLMIDLDRVRATGLDAAMRWHAERHRDELLFVKSRAWSSEREFRWVVQKPGEGEFFVDITSSLRAILVGDRFPREGKRTVGGYALRNHTEVGEMEWRNGVPQPSPSHPRIFANS